MSNMTKKITWKRVISAMTIGTLLVAMQATGVLWGFWRTLDNITWSTPTTSYEYGYGYGDYGFGYGYGYGSSNSGSDFDAGTVTDVTTSSDIVVTEPSAISSTVTIPTGTEITNSTNTPIGDIVNVSISNPTGAFTALEIYPRDASGVKINTTLYFSKPVKIDFNTTTAMTVKVDHGSGYGVVGLTTDANATCSNGNATPAYAGATITNGVIYTCSASNFAATAVSTSTSSSWGGGGGGGWSYVSICTNNKLVCKETAGVYKLFKQDWVSCKNGNLGKLCVITDGTVEVTNPVDDTTVVPVVTNPEPVVTNPEPVDNISTDLDVTYNLDGKISVSNGVATLNSCEFVVKKHTFLDDDATFATKYITTLQELGIINGRDGNGQLFMPESNTTRTEFLKMTLRLFCKDYSSTNTSGLPFVDVNKLDWKAKVIAKALSENLISANNSNFRPNDAISRIEAIKILTLVSGLNITPTNTTVFADVKVSWMKKYVEAARSAGIVNGQTVNGKLIFEPLRSITRAEASKIIINGVKTK